MPAARRKKPAKAKPSAKPQHSRALKIAAKIKKSPAAKPSKEELVSMSKTEAAAGRGKTVPSNPFTRAEIQQVAADKPTVFKTPPKWIYTMIERGASREEVLTRAYQRLERSPTPANIRLVQALLQEFGRPRRRIKTRPLVTQEKVTRIIGKKG